VGAALAAGATIGVAWAAGFGTIAHLIAHPHLGWLGASAGAEAVAYLGYTLAYRELARVQGGPDLGFFRAAAIVAAGFGVFVIRGGFVVDRHALENAGVPARQARTRVLGLGALEYLVLAPAAYAAAVILIARQDAHPSLGFTMPWVIAVPLGFLAALLAMIYRGRISRDGTLRGALHQALDALDMLRELAVRPRRHIAFLGAGLYWTGDIAALWAALEVFHQDISIPALIIGYATGYALTRRTLPLGGAGTVEALVSFALAWAGVPLAPAVLGVFVYRLFNLWLPLLPAAVGFRTLKELAERGIASKAGGRLAEHR
jgi:uncharacterized membrane protein YbhN (UPF0104 family)